MVLGWCAGLLSKVGLLPDSWCARVRARLRLTLPGVTLRPSGAGLAWMACTKAAWKTASQVWCAAVCPPRQRVSVLENIFLATLSFRSITMRPRTCGVESHIARMINFTSPDRCSHGHGELFQPPWFGICFIICDTSQHPTVRAANSRLTLSRPSGTP